MKPISAHLAGDIAVLAFQAGALFGTGITWNTPEHAPATSPEGEVIAVDGIDITPEGRIVDAGPAVRSFIRNKVHDHEAALGRVWRS